MINIRSIQSSFYSFLSHTNQHNSSHNCQEINLQLNLCADNFKFWLRPIFILRWFEINPVQANLEKSQLMIVETKTQAFSLETRILVIYTVYK